MNAEGLLLNCLDSKKASIDRAYLDHNQEYILFNLLIAQCYNKLQREEEATRLIEKYKERVKVDSLLVQSLLLDSI